MPAPGRNGRLFLRALVARHPALRVLRHPRAAARRVLRRVTGRPGLPVGRTARSRTLLRTALGDREHALVLGPAGSARHAMPRSVLDVVGTRPEDPTVTVVSEADGVGSLPQRWDCVVVTEIGAPPQRLLAATGACLPGGTVAFLLRRSGAAHIEGAEVQRVVRGGGVRLVLARVPA